MSARPKTDFGATARAAWGEALPDWVAALADDATRSSGTAAARRIGYSSSVVSQVLSATYAGDLTRVEQKVRGALMGATVDCPVLGEIGRDRCLDEQSRGFSASSSVRARLYRACRGGCPHARIKGDDR